jgi:putative oxygen-independent coproporphyrinogen III oxidase
VRRLSPGATPSNATATRSVGVYVHFPWCLSKCPYCDFVSYPIAPGSIDHAAYADAVIAELDARRHTLDAHLRLASVFFGGGTTSLWEPRDLARVIDAIGRCFDADTPSIEITAESNPSSLEEDRARAMVAAGVNRLSVGVQALDDARLTFLGRLHDADGAIRSIEAARKSGARRVSADLVYAVAGQRPEDAAREARTLAEIGISHLSAYSLSIEPGTRFGAALRAGRLAVADDAVMAESFFAIEKTLGSLGLDHYEVSNYAAPGHEAIHNLGYWRGRDYLGLGCAAYGTLSDPSGGATRYQNEVDPARYLQAALSHGNVTASVEHLDPAVRLRERIMLGLRMAEGVDLGESGRELGIDPWTEQRLRAIERLAAAGRLVRRGDRLSVPRDAWIWMDSTAAALF